MRSGRREMEGTARKSDQARREQREMGCSAEGGSERESEAAESQAIARRGE